MSDSLKLEGIALSRGIALGRIHILTSTERNIPQYFIRPKHSKKEVKRFREALLGAKKELRSTRKKLKALKHLNPSSEAFLDLYEALLGDEEITKGAEERIRAEQVNAEWALQKRTEELSAAFDSIGNEYMKDRKHDIEHVAALVIQAMHPTPESRETKLGAPGRGRLLIAKSISPTGILEYSQRGYEGFVTETGGPNSHAAIIARSLHTPFVGKVAGLMESVQEEDEVILDAVDGTLEVHPSAEAIRRCKAKKKSLKDGMRSAMARRPPGKAQTKDGKIVSLQANIEFPDEMAEAHSLGADEIGLFRTESLVMALSEIPDEDEQYDLYTRALGEARGMQVTFRTLDIGGDKPVSDDPESEEIVGSPLGLRAIRYCLSNPQVFLTQLRALLRASTHGQMRIMFPMFTHPAEVEQTLALLNFAKEQLSNRSQHYAPKIEIGAMIEVPASVFVMDHFARHLDFFSVGTNDLIQYMLAVDREDEKVATLNDPLHPAIIHMLDMISKKAKRNGSPVTLCGEMSGDRRLAPLFLCLGLRRMSMQADRISEVREAVARIDTGKLKLLRRNVLSAQTPESVCHALEAHAT